MKNFSRIAMAATIFAVILNCNGKSTLQVATPGTEITAPAEATSVQARVLADTGATLSIGSSVQLTVPAGALDQDTDISVAKTATAVPQENLVPIGNSIELGAHGAEFNKSVTLNTCYDPAALAARGLSEDTVQVYYLDPTSGNYAAVGGLVNKGLHCVTAQLQHFSTYLIAAQILQGGNNQPVVSAPTFTPSVPLAGLPLKISSIITDFELSVVNGQIGFGQVATAQLFYRIPGEPSFTQVSLTPDYLDETATRYSYKIPANRVTAAGIEYYLKATDNLGLNRVRNTAVLPIARTAVSIAFQTNAAVDLAAGFKRSYTLRAIDDLGTARNIDVDTFTLNGGIGTATKTSASVVQVSATTANAQNYRIGSLTATAGPFSVTSADIRVHAGMLDHIALLSPTGVVLGSTITVNANATYDFDVIGYDAFGNTSNVLPLFVIVPVSGAGTITPTGLYTAPATAQTATLVATLDGVMDSILINVVVPAGWVSLPDLSAGRQNHTATRLMDGRVLIAGGSDGYGYYNSALIFDPNANSGIGSFVATGSMAVHRGYHTATLLPDGRVLIAGGANSAAQTGVEIFDPALNSGLGGFVMTSPMNFPRLYHTATLLNNGRVLITGGYNNVNNPPAPELANAEIFDPSANGGLGAFAPTMNMNYQRYSHTASLLLDGRVLIAGGQCYCMSGAPIVAEIFDPAGNSGNGLFSIVGSMPSQMVSHTATNLPDGRIFLTGYATFIFDPAGNGGMGSFQNTAQLAPYRTGHATELLANGQVLISGGRGPGGQVATVDLFDPGANSGFGSLIPDLPLVSAREGHTATLLNSGKILVVGGFSGAGNPALTSAGIYAP